MSTYATLALTLLRSPACAPAGLLPWSFVRASAGAERTEAGPSPEDMADINGTLNGRGDAFGRLVERYENRVAALMWRFARDLSTCEELVQDAFVEAFFSLRGFRGDSPFLPWLLRIATRVGYRYWKDRSRQQRVARPGPEVLEQIAQCEGEPDPTAAASVLHGLLAELPARDRLVLTLMYLEECDVSATASLTGWSPTMVKVQAYRARKKLKKLVEKSNLLEELGWTDSRP